METQARYTIVGLFTLLIVAAGFVFVYWLHGFADAGALTQYRIRFEAPVIGLRPGVAVLFNGLRVGEVTSVRFDPAAPKILMARIAVDATTPVRQDTQVGIDAQGLLGGATVSLTGGASTAILKPGADGEPPLLVATADETQSLTFAAKTALTQLDGILSDNAQPLRDVIANLSTFSAALAHNSGRVDSILAGLEKMTGGGAPQAAAALLQPERAGIPGAPGVGEQGADLADRAARADRARRLRDPKGARRAEPRRTEALGGRAMGRQRSQARADQNGGEFENAGFAHVGKATDGFHLSGVRRLLGPLSRCCS